MPTRHEKNGLLKEAIRLALYASLATAAVSPAAMAQQNDDEVEEVVTTGSRIVRGDMELTTPVQVFDEEFIRNSGATTVQQFLFESGFSGPGLFNETETLSQAGGSAFFDGKGFGTGYTLILMNGRRLPATPITGEQATDLNQIPLAAIDHIEYLSDGASAIYGSDAIAGVINIVTKKDYEGTGIKFLLGVSGEGDGQQKGIDFTTGTKSDKGSILFSLSYFEQQKVDAIDRPLIRSANSPNGDDGRSPIGLPGTWIAEDFSDAAPWSDCPADRVRASSYTASGQECSYDFAPLYQALPYSERVSIFVTGEREYSDALSGYFEARYSRSLTEVRNGASPAFFFVGVHPDQPDFGVKTWTDEDAAAAIDEGNVDGSGNPVDEYGHLIVPGDPMLDADDNPIPVGSFTLRRFVDAGPRARDVTNSTFATIAGLKFDISDHVLDLTYQKTWVTNRQVGVGGQLSKRRVEEAIEDGVFDPVQTYDPQFFIDNGLAVTTHRTGELEDEIIQAVLTGSLGINMGNSDVRYAAGLQNHKEFYSDRSDGDSRDGDILGGASSDGQGDRETSSVFVELNLLPMENMEVSVAARSDDIKNLDTATTGKIAVSYRPTDEMLVRGSVGTGFKSPELGELYLGKSFGVSRAVDTKLCDAAEADPTSTQADIDLACDTREIRSISGGNPELKPETSKNYSFGFVYNTDGLTASIDYWDIEVDDKVGSLGVQEILNNEDSYPELVHRIGGQLSHPDAFVESNLQNLTKEEGKGIDYAIGYQFEETDIGQFGVDVRINQLLSFKRQSSAIQPLCEDKGTTSEPEFKSNIYLNWSKDNLGATLGIRYVGETEDNPAGRANGSCESENPSLIRSVDSYTQLDLTGRYDSPLGGTLQVGIKNITDEEPPFSEVASGGWPWYDQGLYDNMGRYIFVSYSQEFE